MVCYAEELRKEHDVTPQQSIGGKCACQRFRDHCNANTTFTNEILNIFLKECKTDEPPQQSKKPKQGHGNQQQAEPDLAASVESTKPPASSCKTQTSTAQSRNNTNRSVVDTRNATNTNVVVHNHNTTTSTHTTGVALHNDNSVHTHFHILSPQPTAVDIHQQFLQYRSEFWKSIFKIRVSLSPLRCLVTNSG
eukprot:scaffold34917_cov166-Amphora_coffeaeformis.AAC.9